MALSSPLPPDSSQTNSTLQMNCVYALSGQYGTLPRYPYYGTLVLAIFGRNREWLVIGALVSSLAYAATAAVHVMALIKSKDKVFDLDAVGAWAILSTAALSYVVMIHWSSTIRNSKARIVMIFWGMLIGVSLIFARVILYDQPLGDDEDACYSSDGMLLTSPMQLIKTEFNCSYTCFSVQKPMRSIEEIIAVPTNLVDKDYGGLTYVLLGPIMFAAYVAISWDSKQHTPSQACLMLVMKYLKPNNKDEMMKLIWNASRESWYGGYIALFHWMRRISWGWKKVVMYGFIYPWILLEFLMDVLSVPFLVTNVAFNELDILGSNLPLNESIYNVGQWAPVVNAALVVIAAVINKAWEVKEERQARKTEDVETTSSEFQLRRMDIDVTLVEEIEVNDKDRGRSIASGSSCR